MSEKKSVSLVLGGGAARGLAYIGVIEELNRQGYEIKSIAGSSMGALIGGIYAMGKLDVYTRWVTTLQRGDVFRLLDFSFGRNGLIKGRRVMGLLKSLIGVANIEDLPIRYTAVAIDLETEREEWFTRGPLFDAIRASIAIPTIFTPHRYRGREYIDGSLINPVPISATLNDQTDMTIVAMVGGASGIKSKMRTMRVVNGNRKGNNSHRRLGQFIEGLKLRLWGQEDDSLGMFDIIEKSMSIMENTIIHAQLKAHAPDLVIEIPRDACDFYEFHRAHELIEIGRQKAVAALRGDGSVELKAAIELA